MQRIRLLLLDDHVLFRESLSRLLASEPDIEMVAHCGTPAEARDILARSVVDIVLLDFDLEDELGTRFITSAQAAGHQGKILMVTAGMSAMDSALAWQLGISGIFLKHSSPATLIQAIRQVADGGLWVDQKAIPPAAERTGRTGAQGADGLLTPREQQVLRSVFEGLTNKEIAFGLGVSLSSVKATLQQLFQKTGVRTRSQLVRIAIERSLETTPKPG
jgi:two-component system nitrate/nitrite response regulator NarL